jgi:hypothetical protein
MNERPTPTRGQYTTIAAPISAMHAPTVLVYLGVHCQVAVKGILLIYLLKLTTKRKGLVVRGKTMKKILNPSSTTEGIEELFVESVLTH